MDSLDLSRRASLMFGAAAMLGPGAALGSSSEAARALDLDAPGARAKIRAKIMGSIAAEPVHTYLRIHVYGYRHDGNLIPFYTMNNLNVRRWAPQPDGSFKAQVFECGTYSKFDTDEPLDEWDNPITGERIKVWNFLGGPLSLTVGADGNIATGAETTVKPKPLNFQVFADTVFMLQASAFSYPNPFKPSEWPKESSGERSYWDSHYLFAAKLADVLDPARASAPAFIQLQNLVSWGYWIRMGQTPGRTWGRGFGAKLASLDELPRLVRAEMEKKTPKIFDLNSWTDFVDEVGEYKRTHTPG